MKGAFAKTIAVTGIVIGVAGIIFSQKYPQGVLPPKDWGVTNPRVVQPNIQTTICKSGWTTTIRPSTSYTNALKKRQLAELKYVDQDPSKYEEDHIISLQLGGDPTNERNLWPEPYTAMYRGINLGARSKDVVETYLKRQVCSGKMTLREAQTAIVTDWVKVYGEIKGIEIPPDQDDNE